MSAISFTFDIMKLEVKLNKITETTKETKGINKSKKLKQSHQIMR